MTPGQHPSPEFPTVDLSILLVEDHPEDAERAKGYLVDSGVSPEHIHHVETLAAALDQPCFAPPCFVIADLDLPDSRGLATLDRLLQKKCACPILVLTGNDEEIYGQKAVAMGAQDYLIKSKINSHAIRRCLRYSLERFRLLQEQENLVIQLREALENVKTLRGIVPICAQCKKIRDDHGYWQQVEQYVAEHSEADFSHGMCPDCLQNYYRELQQKVPGLQIPQDPFL